MKLLFVTKYFYIVVSLDLHITVWVPPILLARKLINRKWKSNGNQLIVCVISQAKILNICSIQPLRCGFLLHFSVLCHFILRLFRFWIVGQTTKTKQSIWRCHFGQTRNMASIYQIFLALFLPRPNYIISMNPSDISTPWDFHYFWHHINLTM